MLASRREFLRESAVWAAGAAGGGLLAGSRGLAGPPEEKPAAPRVPEPLGFARALSPRFKLSCAAYSYRQHLDKEKSMTLDGFVEKCARMGLDGAELTSYFFPRTDADYLNHLKRKAFLLGLDISGTAVGNDFCRPPGPEREKDIQHVKAWIEHAARMGAMTIRIFAGSVPRGGNPEEARARAVEGIQECLGHAARHGVILALENHGGITATGEDVLAICRAVSSPWFGVNLDTGNFHTEDPYRDMELLVPHSVTVQLKVEVSARGQKKTEADFPRILAMLRAVNYRGYVALEYEAQEDPLTAVPRYVEKLRGMLG